MPIICLVTGGGDHKISPQGIYYTGIIKKLINIPSHFTEKFFQMSEAQIEASQAIHSREIERDAIIVAKTEEGEIISFSAGNPPKHWNGLRRQYRWYMPLFVITKDELIITVESFELIWKAIAYLEDKNRFDLLGQTQAVSCAHILYRGSEPEILVVFDGHEVFVSDLQHDPWKSTYGETAIIESISPNRITFRVGNRRYEITTENSKPQFYERLP